MLRGGGGFDPGGIFFLLCIDSGNIFWGQTMLVGIFFVATDIVVEFFLGPDHVGGHFVFATDIVVVFFGFFWQIMLI